MGQFLPLLLSALRMKLISVKTLPNTTFEVKRKINTPNIKLDKNGLINKNAKGYHKTYTTRSWEGGNNLLG